MRIRPARPDDAVALAGVHVRSWHAAYAGLLPEEKLAALSVEERAERWRAWLHDPPPELRVWVAEDEERVVGFSSTGSSRDANKHSDTAEVFTIYLEPDVVGTGRGSELFAHTVQNMRERGYATAELWVLAANDRARRFYERAGWHTDGEERTESFDGMELDEIRYVIDL